MVRPWCVRFAQDIDGLANAFSNIIFKYLMVSSYRSISWWEGKCKGVKFHSKFTAYRGGTNSGNYVVHVFSTSPTATPVAAGDEQQPWGPLRRPADPIEAAPLSNGELMLWLQQSALRTGQVFDSQSIEFDADATLPTARIRIVLILHESIPGAVKYEVQNIGSTNAALLGLLGKVTWSGKHMGVLGESQEDASAVSYCSPHCSCISRRRMILQI